MTRPIIAITIGFVLLFAVSTGTGNCRAAEVAGVERETLTLYLFWQRGCPHCAKSKAALRVLADSDRRIALRAIELGSDAEAETLFVKTLAAFGHDRAAVPLVVIGDRSFLGFMDGGGSAGLYRQAASQCLANPCADIVAGFSNPSATAGHADKAGADIGSISSEGRETPSLLPDVLEVPLIGPVTLRDLSLPALTVLLAVVDGFNPCAMWVLVFLIGLLLGLKDERRMWLLGFAFLGATGMMYFAVMAAWLNLILVLGAIIWVRIAIGLMAIGGGIMFLRDYWTGQDAACRVTSPGRRGKIMDAFRSVVNSNRLAFSVFGIMILAILVNFIELLCSAGIPAVYTQVLALNPLPPSTYYLYLGLYIAIFMIDDIAIFAMAMVALRVSGLTGSYAHFSHLIGGVVLLALGAVMVLRPELLQLQ